MTTPALITTLPVNALTNKLPANVPNSIARNALFYSFVLFLIVSLIPFTSYADSSSDLTIFIISFISSFELIHSFVQPNP